MRYPGKYDKRKDNTGCVAPSLNDTLFTRLQALVNMKVSTFRTNSLVFIHFGQSYVQSYVQNM